MARFYELGTNRPLYITKGTRVTALGQGAINVDGYELSYSDASVITHYAVVTSGAGFGAIEREFTAVQKSAPGSLKRPDKLRGLSPWSEPQTGDTSTAGRGGDRRDLPSRVRGAIDAMDARGAWIEDGAIGKANRLVSVLAAGDLIVTVGGKTIPVKENETVEVFAGPEPPRQRIIRSTTFAENVGLLSAYLAARPQ
jgi:hypothetical protein